MLGNRIDYTLIDLVIWNKAESFAGKIRIKNSLNSKETGINVLRSRNEMR